MREMSDWQSFEATPGIIKVCELPAEIIGMKVIKDRLVVECSDGVTYLISENQLEELNE